MNARRIVDRSLLALWNACVEFVDDRGHRDAAQIAFFAVLLFIPLAMLLPAAIRWLISLKEAGVEKLTAETSGLVDEFVETIFALESVNADENHPEDDHGLDGAKYIQGTVIPAMNAVRDVADKLEKIVPDDLWPLPKYSEILFIK